MVLRQKIVLIALFMAGMSTVAFSVLRAVQIEQIQKDGNNSMLLMWGSVEMNVGVSWTIYPRTPIILSGTLTVLPRLALPFMHSTAKSTFH